MLTTIWSTSGFGASTRLTWSWLGPFDEEHASRTAARVARGRDRTAMVERRCMCMVPPTFM